MEFRNTKAIYLQIADYLLESILSQKWREGDRLPSVREMAAMLEVNPNTVMRSYSYLQDRDIIYNQRGIGYFVLEGAYERIKEFKKEEFIKNDLQPIFKTIDLLGLNIEDIEKLYINYKKQT